MPAKKKKKPALKKTVKKKPERKPLTPKAKLKAKLKHLQGRLDLFQESMKIYAKVGIMTELERHDMNSYITGATGLASLVDVELATKEPNLEKLDDRLNIARRMLKLGYRFLGIAHSPRKRAWKSGQLAEKIAEYPRIRQRFLQALKDVSVDIKVVNRASNAVLKADDRWLSRLLLNLTANAVKAIPQQGRVNIVFSNDAKHFNITVSDTGRGMTKEQKRKFYQGISFTTKKENAEDHGRGFAVVRKAIKMHNGRIEIKDNRPEGTVFKIKFPLART